MIPCLLDTDTLSEIIKGRDQHIHQQAMAYLQAYGSFTFSIITRYEILRGLQAKAAMAQIARFNARCQDSQVLSLTDDIIEQASQIYGHLHRTGQLISDADILIAATAMVNNLTLVTENRAHFQRIPDLLLTHWRET
ncbi:MAG: type II toxin-antitoxin system VapC family toxin [Chloroflexota bacterium]